MKTDLMDLFLGSPVNFSQNSKLEKEYNEYIYGALLEKDKNQLKSTGILGSERHILPKTGKTGCKIPCYANFLSTRGINSILT